MDEGIVSSSELMARLTITAIDRATQVPSYWKEPVFTELYS